MKLSFCSSKFVDTLMKEADSTEYSFCKEMKGEGPSVFSASTWLISSWSLLIFLQAYYYFAEKTIASCHGLRVRSSCVCQLWMKAKLTVGVVSRFLSTREKEWWSWDAAGIEIGEARRGDHEKYEVDKETDEVVMQYDCDQKEKKLQEKRILNRKSFARRRGNLCLRRLQKLYWKKQCEERRQSHQGYYTAVNNTQIWLKERIVATVSAAVKLASKSPGETKQGWREHRQCLGHEMVLRLETDSLLPLFVQIQRLYVKPTVDVCTTKS